MKKNCVDIPAESQNAGGVAAYNGIRRDRFCNDGARRDYRTTSNMYTSQDYCVRSDPHFIINHNQKIVIIRLFMYIGHKTARRYDIVHAANDRNMRLGLLKARRDATRHALTPSLMSPLERALIGKALRHVEDLQSARLRSVTTMANLLPENHVAQVFAKLASGWNGYLWPLIDERPDERDALIEKLQCRGVDAFLLWS